MRDVHAGTGELHLGWLEPGGKICLGTGPVVLRFTAEEAWALSATLRALLRESNHGNCCGKDAFTTCGCPPDRVPDTAPAPVSFSWDDGSG